MKRKSYVVFYAIVCLVCFLSIGSYIAKIGVQYFARYDTLEEAFQRQIKGNVEIVDTIQHSDVAMVIYNTNKVSFSDKLFTKDEKGWYAPKNLTNQTIILDKGKGSVVKEKIGSKNIITIQCILKAEDKIPNISDNLNSQIIISSAKDGEVVGVWALIVIEEVLPEDYRLMVGEETILFD